MRQASHSQAWQAESQGRSPPGSAMPARDVSPSPQRLPNPHMGAASGDVAEGAAVPPTRPLARCRNPIGSGAERRARRLSELDEQEDRKLPVGRTPPSSGRCTRRRLRRRSAPCFRAASEYRPPLAERPCLARQARLRGQRDGRRASLTPARTRDPRKGGQGSRFPPPMRRREAARLPCCRWKRGGPRRPVVPPASARRLAGLAAGRTPRSSRQPTAALLQARRGRRQTAAGSLASVSGSACPVIGWAATSSASCCGSMGGAGFWLWASLRLSGGRSVARRRGAPRRSRLRRVGVG
jgi:hypothetical protein